MDKTQNYYQLLHVMPDAPAPVIKASYRAMMQKLRHHPDLGGDPSLAQLLNLAADTLCDPARRAQYDRQLRCQQASSPKPHPAGKKRHDDRTAGASASASASASADSGSAEPSAGSSHGKTRESSQSGNNEHGDHSARSGSRSDEHRKSAHHADKDSTDDAAGQTAGGRNRSREYRPDVARTRLPSRPHCLFCGATSASATTIRQPYDEAGKRCLRCEAPSVTIEELPPSLSEELRRMYRHDIQDTVTLWPHWPKDSAMTASFQDLSLAGCAIECPQKLAGNTLILLETTLLAAICQVRYCKPANQAGYYQAGLQFRTLEIKAQPGTVFSTVA